MNRYVVVTALVGALAASAAAASSGTAQADGSALAQKMVSSLGGPSIWKNASVLHIVEQSYGDGSNSPKQVRYVRDLRAPRIRGEYPDGLLVMSPGGVWREVDGRVDQWPEDRVRRFSSNWPSNIYVLFRRIAAADPRLQFRADGERRFFVLDAGQKVGWFEIADDGSPIRWKRFTGADAEPSEEWIYGPTRWFGSIRFPAWGTRVDGSDRFQYVAVAASAEKAPERCFSPSPSPETRQAKCVATSDDEAEAGRTSRLEFEAMMQRVARGWSTQNAEEALSAFSPNAVYMEPPEEQLFVGHDQLRSYFGAVKPGTFMTWHTLWFDDQLQIGAGEFTFGSAGAETATHGVVVAELRGGRIAVWREFHRPGPADRQRFLDTENKNWRWTIENYP